MRIFSGVFGLIVLAFVLSFAVSNRQDVIVALWPFDGMRQVPLFTVGLVPLGMGLIVGGMIGWVTSLPHRLKVRRLNKELGALNVKIGELQQKADICRKDAKSYSFFRRRG